MCMGHVVHLGLKIKVVGQGRVLMDSYNTRFSHSCHHELRSSVARKAWHS